MGLGKYDRTFYLDQLAISGRSAAAVVPIITDLCAPSSVVDIGCGAGTWLKAFSDAGVTDILGLDGGNADADLLQIPTDAFRSADFQQPFDVGRQFDLAMSVEVAEHLPREFARHFVAELTKLAPVVLFSAAVPRQGGTGHVNEQWPSYWAALFEKHDFVPVDCIRQRIWDDIDVAAYYAQNILMYVRSDALAGLPRLTAPGAFPLDVVHPRIFERKLAHPILRAAGDALPESVKNAIVQPLRSRVSFFKRV